jgi:prepilin-type N-terminal cleavage/methylation domain-containing protein
MELPSTFRPNKGFTMIEVLISLAILLVIFSLGLFVSFDFYRSYALRSEKSTIISALQKARNQSLNNINQNKHGVHFDTNGYTIFEGSTFAGSTNTTLIPMGYNVSVAGVPFDVVFDQLTGQSTDKTISVTANNKTYNTAINSEGQISW